MAKLKEGREAWNEWRKTSDERPDLTGAELDNVLLRSYNLDSADFSGAKLDSVSFDEAVCDGCSFESAVIYDAAFIDTALRRCDFRHVTIGSSTFEGCDFAESDFAEAILRRNSFAHVSFRSVHGLDTLSYESFGNSIGIDTFFYAGGLPEAFLRASHVPKEFIQYASSLVGKAIEYYSCFLSHSSKDDEFVRRLYNDLQGKNIRTWFAPEDLKIGDRFHSRIDESIRIHDKLVIILSANSVTSDWVEREVERALDRERKEEKDILFPIAIDDAGFNSERPWATDIRLRRHIGDFRKWKSHDDYTNAFDRLVRDLKKSQPPIIMKGG